MTILIDHLADITGHRDRERADTLLLDTLRELLAPATVALHRCTGDSQSLQWRSRVPITGRGRRARDTGMVTRFEAHLVEEVDPAWMECLRRHQILEVEGHPTVMLLPLVVTGQGVGVVEVRSNGALGRHTRQTARAIVRLYGNFLALLDYGERDALTGLFNRKTFNECFMRIVLGSAPGAAAAGEAAEPPLSHYMAVLNLDHMKKVNDTFGHLVGDEVLLITSRVMRTALRTEEGLFRFGGEEFVVLLEAVDEESARQVLDRVREQVSQQHYPQAERVTVSIGFTELRPSDLPTSAIERADRALHLAKASGRNRVTGPAAMAQAGLEVAADYGGDVDLF
ncbi:GGDEF domain-containing protein [Azohydromonas lata]|uniref:diguanylate cyclase n=1 Tax=Azohydromonas lata TaxID=45677 RepID=A0ABU5II13_9BURK|nr:GGDEF domain-containing protein [Azohydromonas lata]MDZ5458802.1 GGDEF domain-containing protein [Azohydromonas lata]